MNKTKKAIISGAGLVGSLWALLLARKGYEVDVFERRDDGRKRGFVGGRSINLALSDRGWRALDRAGISRTIRQMAIPMYGRMIHHEDGSLSFQPYGLDGQAIWSVSRAGLNMALIDAAEQHDQIHFHFRQKTVEVDLAHNALYIEHEDEYQRHEAPLIFGADGAFSAVRHALMKTPRFNYCQDYLDYGYKELTIPPAPDGSHRLEPNALHIWPRHQFMLIALPNKDGSFTCTLFLPFEGELSFEVLQRERDVRIFFDKYFLDVVPHLPLLTEEFFKNPTGTLVTIRCKPWHYQHRVLLIGDAAHAIVPFYGQGMNAGFEDCSILDELMEQHGEDWHAIIDHFNATRVRDGHAIANLALRNFVEMRDRVADSKFLLRKQIEKYLHERHPDRFIPIYSMVTFSHLPYHQALEQWEVQDHLFERILAIPGVDQNWEAHTDQIERVFQEWLVHSSASRM